MSKILANIKKQKQVEGHTEYLKTVEHIYKTLIEIDEGRVWESKWSVLIDTKRLKVNGENTYSTFYYPSKTFKAFFKD